MQVYNLSLSQLVLFQLCELFFSLWRKKKREDTVQITPKSSQWGHLYRCRHVISFQGKERCSSLFQDWIQLYFQTPKGNGCFSKIPFSGHNIVTVSVQNGTEFHFLPFFTIFFSPPLECLIVRHITRIANWCIKGQSAFSYAEQF